jgi:predicted ATP-dependent endonuclease of OLD family
MKLNKIYLENFKCFDKININTPKITLLTGANSSGKSSLMYGVLGTIQSREFPFQFSSNGKYIRMGDYGEIIHNQNQKFDINIGYDFETNEGLISIHTQWTGNKQSNQPEFKKLYVNSDYYSLSIEKIRKYDLNLKYHPGIDESSLFSYSEFITRYFSMVESIASEIRENHIEKSKEFDNFFAKYKSFKDKIHFKFENLEQIDSVVKIKGNVYLDTIITTIKKLFTSFDDKINFISSFRLYPERTYYETSKIDLKVGKFGENYEDQIISWETQKSPKFKELITIMNELGLFAEIKTRRLHGGRYEILIRNKKNGVWSSISDVGFGINQFLPIIVADIQLGIGSTLFVAQPEIHLHPSIQAKFADYIVDSIVHLKKRYFIETHSEYIINRLRLAIAEGKIEEDDVNTYYLENDGKKANIYELSLLKNGQIKGAPEGFFETYMLDVMNIALSAK